MQRDAPNVDFDSIRLRLASPKEIIVWSNGEVTKPETINYRTQKTESDGLFCQKIFGPVKDWECACGKYKRIRYKGIICDKCGVEVTRSIVRRERMGHIELATPIAHIWFVRGVPSRVGMVLDMPMQSLEKVVYFASFIISKVDQKMKEQVKEQLSHEFKTKKKTLEQMYFQKVNKLKAQGKAQTVPAKEIEAELKKAEKEQEHYISELEKAVRIARKEIEMLKVQQIISEAEYHDLSLKYGHVFEAGIGAEVIRELLEQVDLATEIKLLEEVVVKAPDGKIKKLVKRLRLLKSLKKNNISPEWMIITALPVLPPDLRPMVQLDGGRFAASDLNDLYRRVINRNNRLKRLKELNAPEVIVRNEKRMLQEAVDALIDNNARHGKTVMASTGQRRVLKSIADMLKGKQGRFRQNLLGKRIDYSGRSVIVVGPNLNLDQCGLPKIMALELFRPFVISKLIKEEYVHNVRSANRFIESGRPEVWDILERITSKSHVLLNRAPTLHRLGIQAFKPLLMEGKAIRLHPLVCAAFNADFDGDQMAVHVPLTEKSKWEAENLMLSTKNLLKPATGDPIVFPSQDMVLGSYFITIMKDGKKEKKPKAFLSCEEEVGLAIETGKVEIQDKIGYLYEGKIIETTPGRVIFNTVVPEELRFVNENMDRKGLRNLVSRCIQICGQERTVAFLDGLMAMSFGKLTTSGISWGMADLPHLEEREAVLSEGQAEVDQIFEQYRMGLLTSEEKHVKVIEVWSKIKDIITDLAKKVMSTQGENPVYYMIDSGARGSWGQLIQMVGMKGLVTSPSGETIELPVKGNFRRGFDVLEYFISTHGARKGLSDTALRTANAGYLTRRLVDIAQDIVVTQEDCGDSEGTVLTQEESDKMGKLVADRALGRVLAQGVKDKDGKTVVKKGVLIGEKELITLKKHNFSEINIRSVLKCKARFGICQACYGWDLGDRTMVKLGTAVGIIAAQSIGEPGTQLTMKTFHTGGVAGKDITQGLPRVEEIFEARPIKKGAVLAEITGSVKIKNEGKEKIITVKSQDGKEEKEYISPFGVRVLADNGDLVSQGDPLTEGSVDLHELYRLKGIECVQRYIILEIQNIYFSQGQDLNDKHIEIICKQMFSRVYIIDGGDSTFLSGDIVDKTSAYAVNARMKKEKKKPVKHEQLFLGMTKASLATSSFLSAASFQETARVLIDAAIMGSVDKLRGLKENVIIGRLIPAGTGFTKENYED